MQLASTAAISVELLVEASVLTLERYHRGVDLLHSRTCAWLKIGITRLLQLHSHI